MTAEEGRGTMLVRQARAHHGEVVEIRWTLKDGSFFYTRHTVPPQSTIDASRATAALTESPSTIEADQALAAPLTGPLAGSPGNPVGSA